MSDAARNADETPHGVKLLPRDLTEEELGKAPLLVSVDVLIIEGLTADEDDDFAAALGS